MVSIKYTDKKKMAYTTTTKKQIIKEKRVAPWKELGNEWDCPESNRGFHGLEDLIRDEPQRDVLTTGRQSLSC
jgi:hypothetical protein